MTLSEAGMPIEVVLEIRKIMEALHPYISEIADDEPQKVTDAFTIALGSIYEGWLRLHDKEEQARLKQQAARWGKFIADDYREREEPLPPPHPYQN